MLRISISFLFKIEILVFTEGLKVAVFGLQVGVERILLFALEFFLHELALLIHVVKALVFVDIFIIVSRIRLRRMGEVFAELQLHEPVVHVQQSAHHALVGSLFEQ